MPWRILHLVHWLNPGGVERWVLSLLECFNRAEFALDVCCKGPTRGLLSKDAEELGARVVHCPLGKTSIGYSRRLARIIEEGRYDLLHVHAGAVGAPSVRAAKRAGIPVVLTYHSTSPPSDLGWIDRLRALPRNVYTSWDIRSGCGQADRVLGCSEAVLDSLRARYGIGVNDRQGVWYCGVKAVPLQSIERRKQVRESLRLSDDQLLVINVGSLTTPKNHRGLLRIAAQVRSKMDNILFVVAGEGPLRPSLESKIRVLNLQSGVKLLGVCPDVFDLLGASDIFLFPSLWEGLPVALIEAQMAQLPAVASNIASIREAVVPGASAELCEIAEEDAMSEAICNLAGDRARRVKMGKAGRNWVLSRFTDKHSAAQIAQIYQELFKESA